MLYSIESIRNQTVTDFEVHIIGDGATKETAKIAQKFSKQDPRIFYHPFAKSPRTGEPYRDEILATSNSKYVCYLADDDLWFPDHLETMAALMAKGDFVYTYPLLISPDGQVQTWYGNLNNWFYRNLFLDPKNLKYNVIPLSCAGHTLAAYKSLPKRWETTPVGKHTDLHMWQKFVTQANVIIKKSPHLTVIHLASSLRKDLSPSERMIEIKSWAKKMKTAPQIRLELAENALEFVTQDFLNFRAKIYSTKGWKALEFIRNFIGINR